ncbi:hypothetical protein J8M97_03395 [Gordonia polyisoprenivorans]|uniref:hypothetical protein n=1 Tax=Gordonia polyisoprenivorans TaxID=84595 RepID=UPI001B8D8FF1|nr:hypothetical protein [Gordonia polyisoprenivorans]QUD83716.1 hypothetical protein J8M97_03395 [Gordonia polyisoprenivorans]
MSGLVVAGIVVGAVLAITLLGAIGLVIAYGLATRPDRFAVREVALGDVDRYIATRAAFAISLEYTTPLSRREVWDRLAHAHYLSSLPFLRGPIWIHAGASEGNAPAGPVVGDGRTMSGTFLSVAQRATEVIDGQRITLTGTGVSVPLAIKDFAERFTISDGPRPRTLTVRWEIAGSPRWVAFLPWRWGVPLVRPVLAFVLRHILRLKPFRRPRDNRGPDEHQNSGTAVPH